MGCRTLVPFVPTLSSWPRSLLCLALGNTRQLGTWMPLRSGPAMQEVSQMVPPQHRLGPNLGPPSSFSPQYQDPGDINSYFSSTCTSFFKLCLSRISRPHSHHHHLPAPCTWEDHKSLPGFPMCYFPHGIKIMQMQTGFSTTPDPQWLLLPGQP